MLLATATILFMVSTRAESDPNVSIFNVITQLSRPSTSTINRDRSTVRGLRRSARRVNSALRRGQHNLAVDRTGRLVGDLAVLVPDDFRLIREAANALAGQWGDESSDFPRLASRSEHLAAITALLPEPPSDQDWAGDLRSLLNDLAGHTSSGPNPVVGGILRSTLAELVQLQTIDPPPMSGASAALVLRHLIAFATIADPRELLRNLRTLVGAGDYEGASRLFVPQLWMEVRERLNSEVVRQAILGTEKFEVTFQRNLAGLDYYLVVDTTSDPENPLTLGTLALVPSSAGGWNIGAF